MKLPPPALPSRFRPGLPAAVRRAPDTVHASRITHHVSRFSFHVSRTTHHASRPSPAFTLLEILVAVALLSFIVLGLFAMFNQTQRAFRSSMTQTDILEAGRAVTEMIPLELQQTVPSDGNAFCYYSQVIPSSAPLVQMLPGATPPGQLTRTNYLEDCFMLLRQNQNWVGIGYLVRTNDANGRLWLPEAVPGPNGKLGAGTLYRFSVTVSNLFYNPHSSNDPRNWTPQDPSQLYLLFRNVCAPGSPASATVSNRICDGVVHFRMRAFAVNGFPLFSDLFHTNACYRTNSLTVGWSLAGQTLMVPNATYPNNPPALYCWSNAVPGAVELELGLLEQYAWDRYNSIGSPADRLAYLQREDISSRVHLFRERIPLRNVDPSVYP